VNKPKQKQPPPTAAALRQLTAGRARYRLSAIPWSIGDDYLITDAQSGTEFVADGRLVDPPRRIAFKNSAGLETIFIRERVLTVDGRIEITRNDDLVALVHPRILNFAWVKHTVIYPPEPSPWETFQINEQLEALSCDGRPLACYTRLPGRTPAYDLHLSPARDHALLLATIVAIIDSQRRAIRGDLD
jgi:hypothetical protein